MKKSLSVAALWAVFALPAFACERPAAPAAIPDGKSADMETMMTAKKAVDAFKAGMEAYITCEKSATNISSAKEELVKIADRFNAEVRAFKAKG